MEQKRISCQGIRYVAADTGKVCREGDSPIQIPQPRFLESQYDHASSCAHASIRLRSLSRVGGCTAPEAGGEMTGSSCCCVLCALFSVMR